MCGFKLLLPVCNLHWSITLVKKLAICQKLQRSFLDLPGKTMKQMWFESTWHSNVQPNQAGDHQEQPIVELGRGRSSKSAIALAAAFRILPDASDE